MNRFFSDRHGFGTPDAKITVREDAVIAFALLEGIVPHFSDPNAPESARKLLYVVASRPRKNLHLIAEVGRINGIGIPYETTQVLSEQAFAYDQVGEDD